METRYKVKTIEKDRTKNIKKLKILQLTLIKKLIDNIYIYIFKLEGKNIMSHRQGV